MSYARHDFSECLKIVLAGRDGTKLDVMPKRVIRAWGHDNDGWAGGFVLELVDGRYAYVEGSCDYTGWG